MRLGIAVPGSDGLGDLKDWFTRQGYRPRGVLPVYLYDGKLQKNTLGVMFEESKIDRQNQYVLDYPQNLNVTKPILTKGDLGKATHINQDTLYGRSVSIGVRNLRNLICSIHEKYFNSSLEITLFGYSQGSEIVQIFLSNAQEALPNHIYQWFCIVFNRALLLANPVHSVREGTGYKVDNVEVFKTMIDTHYGSLVSHRSQVPMALDDVFRRKVVNILSVKDAIALYPKKVGTYTNLNVRHVMGVTASSIARHTNYTGMRAKIAECFSDRQKVYQNRPLGLESVGEVKTKYDNDYSFSLAKQYLNIVAGEGTDEYKHFYYHSMGISEYHRVFNWRANPVNTNLTNYRGVLHKKHMVKRERVIQTIIWSSITRIILGKTDFTPKNHVLHEFSDYLTSIRFYGMLTPYMLMLKLANTPRGKILPSSFVSDIDWVGRNTDINSGVLMAMLEWNLFDKSIIPDWSINWTGNCDTKQVREFLTQSIEEVTSLQNVKK